MNGTVEGRTCGTCNLCCKIVEVTALNKPANVWCEHCDVGRGCRIYEQRSAICREFFCRYMRDPSLDARWNPATAHFLLRAENAGTLVIQVDPQRPEAWKREPYHSTLRERAKIVYPSGGMMFVKIGERALLILPDRDEDLGICSAQDRVAVRPSFTPTGVRWEVKMERGTAI
jgi:hypothetical protein